MAGNFSQGADHFVMVAVADEHDAKAFLGKPDRLQVHFGHQRARGVDHFQPPRDRLRTHRG